MNRTARLTRATRPRHLALAEPKQQHADANKRSEGTSALNRCSRHSEASFDLAGRYY